MTLRILQVLMLIVICFSQVTFDTNRNAYGRPIGKFFKSSSRINYNDVASRRLSPIQTGIYSMGLSFGAGPMYWMYNRAFNNS